MWIASLLAAQCVSYGIARSAPADDMANLSASCENAAAVLDASLNQTMAMNTSGLLQGIMWQVGASTANLRSNATLPSSNSSSNLSPALDAPYFHYIDTIRTLSEALVRRGRMFHQEMNLPVYTALQGLATAVQAYGMQLYNAGSISQNATIRTLTAGSSLVDAEGVWANNANYPGPRRAVQFVR